MAVVVENLLNRIHKIHKIDIINLTDVSPYRTYRWGDHKTGFSHFSKMISTVKIRNNNNSKGVREKQVLPQTKAT